MSDDVFWHTVREAWDRQMIEIVLRVLGQPDGDA